MSSSSLKKHYTDLASLKSDLSDMLSHGGLSLLSHEDLELRSRVKVELSTAMSPTSASLDAEVVFKQATDTGNVYGLALLGSYQDHLQAFTQIASDQGADAESLVAPNAHVLGQDAQSLYHRIQNMTMPEKMQLALHGNREERNLLLKTTGGTLHTYVLKNPRLTPEEVTRILRTPHTTVDMILTIAQNRDWLRHPSVRIALVKNPKTPLKISQEHMPSLPDHELYALAKSEHIREAVSKLARRLLAQKGKSVT